MTQLEKFKTLMDEFGLNYEEETTDKDISITITDSSYYYDLKNTKVNCWTEDGEGCIGYSGFGSTHYFNLSGEFKYVWFWE
jgi:hypothetical protein